MRNREPVLVHGGEVPVKSMRTTVFPTCNPVTVKSSAVTGPAVNGVTDTMLVSSIDTRRFTGQSGRDVKLALPLAPAPINVIVSGVKIWPCARGT